MKLDRDLLARLVYGSAVGDALGVPYEFKGRNSFTCYGMVGFGTHNQPEGTWSDDTSMIIATVDSLRQCGQIDVDDMRQRFCDWLRCGTYAIDHRVFDVGCTVSRALSDGVGCSGERDNGNGSLMRILPLALTDCTDDEVRAVSAITHAHEKSTEACVTLVHFARSIIDGTEEVPALDYEHIRGSGYVVDTLRAAIWCYTTTDSYRQCVLEAVNLGDDTDTTACVAGGLAGLKYGFGGKRGIPDEWYETLRGKSLIDAVI